MRPSRRGFTLVELLVYLALVSTALVMFLGLELGARQSVALQQGLIDVEEESRRCLDAFRRDVESAREVLVAPSELKLIRHDGVRVAYRQGERRQLDPQGSELGRDLYPRTTAMGFTVRQGQVAVVIEVERRLALQDTLRRTYRRVASPRAATATVQEAP